MRKSDSGPFSQGLGSIEFQLSALFSGVGGDKAVSLLDALSNLTESEREIVLTRFTEMVGRIADGEVRLSDDRDAANQQWEDKLYQDIVSAFSRPAANTFGLIEGGKNKRAALLEFTRARKARQQSIPPDAA